MLIQAVRCTVGAEAHWAPGARQQQPLFELLEACLKARMLKVWSGMLTERLCICIQNKIVLLECDTNVKYNPKVNACSNIKKYNRNKIR